jgi:cytochrome bd ubiquinol oxidase subunit I
MDLLYDHVMLSRLQFAATTMFHINWPLLSIGLSIFLVVTESLWLKTKNPVYYHQARFWAKLFLLNFAVGVVSGLPLEFQFGTNWSRFSTATHGFFGNILGFEGAMAFMLEAGFLGIMVFGWKRVSPRFHLFSTCMVALGASLSAFWIMVVNSWMQTPAGGSWVDGRYVMESYWQGIFNPDLPWGFSHMWVACLETTLFVVGGLSAWYILKNRHVGFFLKSFKLALLAALIITPLQIWLGDASGRAVAEYQPTKLGAIEAHWETNPPGQGAPWKLLAWPDFEKQKNAWTFLEIPSGLSLLITRSLTGQVKGLKDFPRGDQPPIVLPFYSFRIMIGIGFAMFGLMFWTLWAWYKKRLTTELLPKQKWLLYAWIAFAPLGYLAVEMGWVTREVGRQPWIIFGLLRTRDGASVLPASAVATSLGIYLALYIILLLAFIVFAWRILKRGPNLEDRPPIPFSSRGGE